MQRLVVVALAAFALVSCAGSQSSSAPPPAAQSRSRPDVLTEADLAKTEAPNALLVVQQMRPTWLRGRASGTVSAGAPPEVVVYVNGARVGSPRDLEQISRNSIKEMRYLSASDATTRWGTGHSLGAITVTTR
jgi:hypothetical protein